MQSFISRCHTSCSQLCSQRPGWGDLPLDFCMTLTKSSPLWTDLGSRLDLAALNIHRLDHENHVYESCMSFAIMLLLKPLPRFPVPADSTRFLQEQHTGNLKVSPGESQQTNWPFQSTSFSVPSFLAYPSPSGTFVSLDFSLILAESDGSPQSSAASRRCLAWGYRWINIKDAAIPLELNGT